MKIYKEHNLATQRRIVKFTDSMLTNYKFLNSVKYKFFNRFVKSRTISSDTKFELSKAVISRIAKLNSNDNFFPVGDLHI